jgi:APA family basic amino acid/polyamine antiporter
MRRGFRVPWSPVVPALSAIGAVGLIVTGLPLFTIIRYVAWLIIGLCVYFFYSRPRSRLAQSVGAAARQPA